MNPLFPLDAFPHWPQALILQGGAQIVSFGNLFIANPDLPARFAAGVALASADRATMYGGGEHGYTVYPSMPGELDLADPDAVLRAPSK